MIQGLLGLAAVAAVIAVVGYAWAWLSSAPAADSFGPVASLRRSLHARESVKAAFCSTCRSEIALAHGYCSDACAAHDGEMQAIA